MVLSKTNDHIQIKIKMLNPSQEPPASSKAPDEDLKDMDILCTFKIKIQNQNSDHGCIKDQWPYQNQDKTTKIEIMDVSKASDHFQIKIKMLNPSQEPPLSSKAPNGDLKDKDVLCTFKIKIERKNLDHGCIIGQWPYPNQDQDAKP